jgi:Domain of unknown function (DUF5801)
MIMTTIAVGPRYVLDESAGLQDTTDNDIAYASLPAAFRTFLDALGLSSAFPTANGAAKSASNVITVASAGPVTALTLHDSANGTLNGDDSGLLTLAGNHIFLYATSDPHIVIGRAGSGATANPLGAVAFSVYLESAADNKSATLYTVEYEAIRHPDATNPDDVVDLGQSLKVGASGDFNFDLATLASGQLLFGSFGDSNIAVIVIAKDQTTGDGDKKDTVNTSKGGGPVTIGVSNQMFDPGEGAFFTFVSGMNPLASAGSNQNNGAALIQYGDVYASIGASFSISQIQGSGNTPKTNVLISAFTTAAEKGAAFITGLVGDTQRDVLPGSVKVFLAGVDITASVTVQEVGLSVRVIGVPVNATVRYETDVEHNRLLVENENGNPFDIGGFALVGPPTFATIGQAIGFGDDGPNIALALSGNSAITDESTTAPPTDGGQAEPNDNDGRVPTLTAAARLIGYDEAAVVIASGASLGTDGGTAAVYSLKIGNSNDSGLTTTDGTSILLFKEGSVVVGRAGGEAIFAIGIDAATGNVTTEQYDSIRHSPVGTADDLASIAGSVLFAVASVTDGDGDSAAPQVDIGAKIGFEDDGPSVTLALNLGASMIIDESLGFDASDPNANDEAGQAAGVIGYASKADLFGSTLDVGEDEEGATSAYSFRIDAALTALKVSNTNSVISLVAVNASTVNGVSADGQLAFTLAIDAGSGAVTLSQFIALEHPNTSDGDDSIAFGSGLISAVRAVIDGDGDTASASVDLGAIIAIEDDGPKIDQTSGDDLFVDTVGVTVSGDFIIDGGTDAPYTFNIISAPDTNGFTFANADVNGDGITGQNEVIGKLNGVNFYSLFVDVDGSYDFKLLSAPPGSTTKLDLADIKAGGPQTNFIEVGALASNDVVKISGYFDADGAGPNPRAGAAVNESNNNVGVVNGNLDANETLSFSLYDAFGSANPAIDISGISVGTKTPKATNYTYTAYDNGVPVPGMINVAINVPKNGIITIDAPAGKLFDTVDIVSVNGSAVKVGLGDIVIRRAPSDYVLDFDLRLTDSNGDSVDTGFLVSIDGNHDGQITNAVAAFTTMQPVYDVTPFTNQFHLMDLGLTIIL